MESTFAKIFFVSSDLGRLQDLLKLGKEAHDEIGCNESRCAVETFLNILFDFIFNKELTYENCRFKFIEVCSAFTSIFNTSFAIQQSGHNNS